MARSDYLFTSESVSEGHPDKVSDRISDEVVDLFFREGPKEGMSPWDIRAACETLCTTNRVVIAGETRGPKSVGAGAIEALEGANRKAQIVGINGTKEAIDAIKAGKMLASGDYNGFLQGCVATMVAIRELRKLPVPREVVFKAGVIDKTNYQSADVPADKLVCPKWEDAIKG